MEYQVKNQWWKEVEDFVDHIIESQKRLVKTIGLGRIYKLESDSGKGLALVDESYVVHMDFFFGEITIDVNPFPSFPVPVYYSSEGRIINKTT